MVINGLEFGKGRRTVERQEGSAYVITNAAQTGCLPWRGLPI